MLNYRKIEAGDDAQLAEIIRANLEKYHLNIPGTVYFDPELNHLSKYYGSDPQKKSVLHSLRRKRRNDRRSRRR